MEKNIKRNIYNIETNRTRKCKRGSTLKKKLKVLESLSKKKEVTTSEEIHCNYR